MPATMAIRSMAGDSFIYSDGVYLFHTVPSMMDDVDMVLLLDTNYNVAQFINQYGYGYNVDSMDVRPDEGTVGFHLGTSGRSNSDHLSLIRSMQPHIPTSFKLYDEAETIIGEAPEIKERVPWMPPLMVAANTTPVYREVREERAKIALKYLYHGARDSSIEAVIGAIEHRTNTYMNQWDDITRYAIRGMYDRHCDAMVEIKNVMNYERPMELDRKYTPITYSTIPGAGNEIAPYIVHPFRYGTPYTPLCIITPLPWLVVARMSKAWWENNEKMLSNIKELEGLYTDGRAFCDVHVPVMWRGGIDSYLWGEVSQGMVAYQNKLLRDPGTYQEYFDKVMDWMNG
jgi:hypothetical protein